MEWKRKILVLVCRILDRWKLFPPLMKFMGRWTGGHNPNSECRWPYIKPKNTATVQFLAYHRVSDIQDSFLPPMPVQMFERQMTYLARHCTVLSLDEAVERIKVRDVPHQAVVVTFDDGYADNYLYAFPILKRLSIPATIFLPTDVIGTGKILWHDQVFSALSQSNVSSIEDFPGQGDHFFLDTVQGKRLAQDAILRYLRSLEASHRNQEIRRLFSLLHFSENWESSRVYLDWSEVQVMQSHGIGFGSHTVSHPILSLLSDEDAREEVLESKSLMENMLGLRVKSFAYPSGRRQDFSDNTKAILRECGYDCAVTMIFGTNSVESDLYEIKRTTYWDDDPHLFGARLTYHQYLS